MCKIRLFIYLIGVLPVLAANIMVSLKQRRGWKTFPLTGKIPLKQKKSLRNRI